MAKKRFYDNGGYEGRVRQEREDSAMISGGKGEFANLPQRVVMKSYPKFPYSTINEINDELSGIDAQMEDDIKGLKKNASEKY